MGTDRVEDHPDAARHCGEYGKKKHAHAVRPGRHLGPGLVDLPLLRPHLPPVGVHGDACLAVARYAVDVLFAQAVLLPRFPSLNLLMCSARSQYFAEAPPAVHCGLFGGRLAAAFLQRVESPVGLPAVRVGHVAGRAGRSASPIHRVPQNPLPPSTVATPGTRLLASAKMILMASALLMPPSMATASMAGRLPARSSCAAMAPRASLHFS